MVIIETLSCTFILQDLALNWLYMSKPVLRADCLFYSHKLSVCQTTYVVKRKWVPIREFKVYSPVGLVVIVLCPLRNVSQESFLTCDQFLRAVSGLELVFIDEHHRVTLLLDPRVHNGLYVKIFARLDKKIGECDNKTLVLLEKYALRV